MGCEPLLALNVIGFPKDLSMDILAEILKGGASKAAEAGIPVIGGHTVDDNEPKYGLVVTAIAEIDDVVSNAGARVGDALILTKPLGSGIVVSALKKAAASPELIERVTTLMATLNRDAARAMREVMPHACTDVTGFGLLGHLHEMTAASAVGAEIIFGQVPVMEEVWGLARKGHVPGGTLANLKFFSDYIEWEPSLSELERLVLCDAQTSGGLLIACDVSDSDRLIDLLKKKGTLAAHPIGRIIESPSGRIRVRK
jgi:selenide,water dikinase